MAALTLEQLTAAADAGEIDTVILAQVDMQGRMMGKRLHVRHFLESGYKESHSCNYLLAADLEMEPVPGFRNNKLGARLRRLHNAPRPGNAQAGAMAARHGARAGRYLGSPR